jgi:hypothetical protein
VWTGFVWLSKDRWQALVIIMNGRVAGILLTNRTTVSFSRRTASSGLQEVQSYSYGVVRLLLAQRFITVYANGRHRALYWTKLTLPKTFTYCSCKIRFNIILSVCWELSSGFGPYGVQFIRCESVICPKSAACCHILSHQLNHLTVQMMKVVSI